MGAATSGVTRAGRVVRALAFAVLALRVVAFAQTGCMPLRVDGAWRAAVRARAESVVTGARVPEGARWVRRAQMLAPYVQVTDLASTPRGLAVAASIDALGVDGAALARWDGRTLTTLLTWSGQGFLRVHAWGDRLVVPDADAPFQVLPFAFDLDVDGYVFISDAEGAITDRQRVVLPAVYHVFDVARLASGRLVASTGAYRPEEIPYRARVAPAALFGDDGDGRPWRRLLVRPRGEVEGVHRYVYLLALPDGGLLASVEWNGLPGLVRIDDLEGDVRVTAAQNLGAFVLRMALWRGAVWVITGFSYDLALSRSDDGGRSFRRVDTPAMPQSLAPDGDTLWMLGDGGLYRTNDGVHFEAKAPRVEALVHRASPMVSAPLVVHRGSVWSASPQTGELFEAAR